MTGRLRRILVIRLGALGDLIQAFDAFYALRQHHAGDHLTLMTAPAYAGFARAMPWFDAVWEDCRPRWWQGAAWWALRRRWQQERPDRVYDLQNKLRTALYYHLLSRWRKPEWSGRIAACWHSWPADAEAAIPNRARYLGQIQAAGVPAAGPADLSWLNADLSPLMARAGLVLPERFVVLIPGCSPHLPHKRWPGPHYVGLAQRLIARGLGCVLVGTQAEAAVLSEIAMQVPQALNLVGQTSVLEVAALARRAAGVVGNDTGPVFLTAAVGTPTLMLMSHHTDPARSAPPGLCTGWLKREHLATLTVDEVEQALRLR